MIKNKYIISIFIFLLTFYSVNSVNTAPSISDLEEPTDPSIYSYGQSYEFNSTICDVDGINEIDTILFEWDGVNSTNVTTTTEINSTCGEWNYTLIDLVPQTATVYAWYVNDSSDANATPKSGTFTVSKSPAPCSVVFEPSSPIYNNQQFLAYSVCSNIDDGCNCTLERNDTSTNYEDVTATENNTLVSLSRGGYKYRCESDATQNFTSYAGSDNYYHIYDTSDLTASYIRVYTNGTDSYPNMTTGTHYVEYLYEGPSYLSSSNSGVASSVFLMVIVGTMVFAYFAITGDIGMGIIGGLVSLVIMATVIIPIVGNVVGTTREYSRAIDEPINFAENNTYYKTEHSPIVSIVAMYSDTSHTGIYDSSQYSFINSGG